MPKYGWASTDTFTGDGDIVLDGTFNGSFYMPAEPDAVPDGETTATGDRLNSGDKLNVWAGDGTPTANCADELKIKLGATAIVAGAAALAAALAI